MDPIEVGEIIHTVAVTHVQKERLNLMLVIANKAAAMQTAELKATRTQLALANTMKAIYQKRWNEATGWPHNNSDTIAQRDLAVRQRERAVELLNKQTEIAERYRAMVEAAHANSLEAAQLTRRAINANAELRATIKHLRSQQASGSPQHPDAEHAELRAENAALKRKLIRAVKLLQQGATASPADAPIAAIAAALHDAATREVHGWACQTHAQGLRIADFDPRDYGTIESRGSTDA